MASRYGKDSYRLVYRRHDEWRILNTAVREKEEASRAKYNAFLTGTATWAGARCLHIVVVNHDVATGQGDDGAPCADVAGAREAPGE